MLESVKTKEEEKRITEFYSEKLTFLWKEYNKLVGYGILFSGGSLVLLLLFVFNTEGRELIKAMCDSHMEYCINSFMLKLAIGSLFIATVCFICCRWCSQILMERQIYAKAEDALYYFEKILENETVLPSALMPKEYSSHLFISRVNLLKFVGNLNEFTKWSGVILVSIGCFSALYCIFPLLSL
jgi:hypothetical protein